MKRCPRCRETKPINDFHRNKARKGGVDCYCKMCKAQESKEYYLENMEKTLNSARRYRIERGELIRVCFKAYYESNKARIKHHVKQYKLSNPKKVKAHRVVERAIRIGDLSRLAHCESCGCKCKSDAHHEDYSEPLEVVWLCKSCHITLHRGVL